MSNQRFSPEFKDEVKSYRLLVNAPKELDHSVVRRACSTFEPREKR